MLFTRQQENLIAAFRGLPADTGRISSRPVASIDSLALIFLQKLGTPSSIKPEKVIIEHWREIVGDSVAHRCAPVRIMEGKVLVIQVPDAVLRQELLFQRVRILQKVRALPACEALEKILLR